MTDFPRSLPEFERRFPDEAACAEWLLEHRWSRGFACPGCGHDRFWRLGRKVLTLQCRACRRETSVTAGTVMHRSHLPLKVWFTAAWLVATHRNGMSARQLWLQLGLGSYKSAWLLLRKLRAAMVDPDREPLAGLVEVDETSLPFRGGGEPARARPVARRQAADRRRGRDPGRRSGTDPAGGDRGLLGREPGRLRRRQRGRGQHGGERRLVRLRRAQGRQARPEGGRRRAGPRGAALDPPRLREREAVGAGVSTTGCARSTSRPTSTSSCSGSTDAARLRPPSPASSASPSDRTASLRRSRRDRAQRDKPFTWKLAACAASAPPVRVAAVRAAASRRPARLDFARMISSPFLRAPDPAGGPRPASCLPKSARARLSSGANRFSSGANLRGSAILEHAARPEPPRRRGGKRGRRSAGCRSRRPAPPR